MRKFNITVNGTLYEVEVEEVSATETASAPKATSAPKAAAAAPKAAPKASGSAGSVKVNAPMPGTIMKINTTVGQKVAKGDVLCVLEAMKMENEICAPSDGTVASVEVTQGASVGTGDLLITLN